MIAYVRNNEIIEQPQPAPKTWMDINSGKSYSGFYNMSIEEMLNLGWKEVVDIPLKFKEGFQTLEIGRWYYDEESDIVTRDYTIKDINIGELQWGLILQLEDTKVLIQEGGVIWNDGTKDWQVDTRESSKNKISDEVSAVIDNTRGDSGLFQFMNGFKLINDIQVREIGQLVRNHYISCYPITANFLNMILSATTIEQLESIKEEIEDKNNWPETIL